MPPHPTPPVLHRQSGSEFRPTRHVVIREPLLDRIADALGSDRIIPLYLAFCSGALFAAGMALLWARVL